MREGTVDGAVLKLRMTLMAGNAPIEHVIEAEIGLEEPTSGNFGSGLA